MRRGWGLRSLKRLVLGIVILSLLAAVSVASLFYRAMPNEGGQVAMPGLGDAVKVYRDEHGVPHIFAATMNDAARTLGYIHASERLFQMEMQRRAGQGRLAEVIGKDGLGVDKYIRTLGLYHLAQSSFAALSPDAQGYLSAYADGVNAWLSTHGTKLPPEFLILGIRPEPWQPADSVVWGKLMALQLSHNVDQERLRARLAPKITPSQLAALFPAYPANAPITIKPQRGLETTKPVADLSEPDVSAGVPSSSIPVLANAEDEVLHKLGEITGLELAASNEWVITGAHTVTGKPILANDPHLSLEAPILWFLARIVTPDFSIKGATVPGLPIFLLGQNDHLAWGFTTTDSDTQDLFVETIDARAPDHYVTPSGSEPFISRDEIIHVKGGQDIALHVRATRHGPVMSDIQPELAALAGNGHLMALSFSGLGDKDTTPEALLRMNRAKDIGQFSEALKLYQTPTQNIVYASDEGHIGYISPGLVPVRAGGDGLFPADGASGKNDWTGWIPFDHLPSAQDPEAGFLFNANNAVVADKNPDYFGRDWEEPYRARRIQQFFDSLETHSLDTSAAMQSDHASLAARELLPYLLQAEAKDDRTKQALAMMQGWDGTMDRARAEPLIFSAWVRAMHKHILVDKTGDALKAKGPIAAQSLGVILSQGGAEWCGTADKPDPKCTQTITTALSEALAFIVSRDGPDMKNWRWGDEHQASLRHKFYSHILFLKAVSDLSVPSSGDFYTLDRGGGFEPDEAHPFARTHGGGFRGIYDLANPSRSRFVIATGESGHIFSRHYGDMVQLWNDGQGITLSGSADELDKRGATLAVFSPIRN